MAGDAAGPSSVRFTMLVTNGDALVIEADDTRIGDGDTEDIAREVFQYGLLALSPHRAMDDPRSGPCGLGQRKSGSGRRVSSAALNLPRKSLAKDLYGTRKELRAGYQWSPSSEMPPPVTRP